MKALLLIALSLPTAGQLAPKASTDDWKPDAWRKKLVSTKHVADDGGWVLVYTMPDKPDRPMKKEYFNKNGRKYKAWDGNPLWTDLVRDTRWRCGPVASQTDYFNIESGKRQSSEVEDYRDQRHLLTYLPDGNTVSSQTVLSPTGAAEGMASITFRPGTNKPWVSSSLSADGGSFFKYFARNGSTLERTIEKDRMTVEVHHQFEREVVRNVLWVESESKKVTSKPTRVMETFHLSYRQRWVLQRPKQEKQPSLFTPPTRGRWVLQSVDMFGSEGHLYGLRVTMKADGVTVDRVAELKPKPGQGCVITEYQEAKVLPNEPLTDVQRSALKEFAPGDDLSIPR